MNLNLSQMCVIDYLVKSDASAKLQAWYSDGTSRFSPSFVEVSSQGIEAWEDGDAHHAGNIKRFDATPTEFVFLNEALSRFRKRNDSLNPDRSLSEFIRTQVINNADWSNRHLLRVGEYEDRWKVSSTALSVKSSDGKVFLLHELVKDSYNFIGLAQS